MYSYLLLRFLSSFCSFERRVKDIMHQAFWDYLESQLNEDPPSYINAIKMLSDIKEVRNKSKRYSLQSDKPSRMYYGSIL